MATLFNTKIKDTYQSLLKLEDNTILTTTTKNVTDGLGNASPLYMSTTRVGIGTNAPISTLNVLGLSTFIGASGSTLGSTTAGAAAQFYQNGFSALLAIGGFANNGAELQTYTNGGITVGGTNIYLQRQSGNVLIGGTTGAGKLTVQGTGSTSATTSLLVQNSAGTEAMRVRDDRKTLLNGGLEVSDGTYTGFISNGLYNAFGYNTSPQQDVVLRVSFATGTSVSTLLKLDNSLNGAGAGATTKPLVILGNSSQTANLIELQNSSGTALSVFTANGSLGIGTSSPTERLDLVGNISLGSTTAVGLNNLTGKITFKNGVHNTRIQVVQTSASFPENQRFDFYAHTSNVTPTFQVGFDSVVSNALHTFNENTLTPATKYQSFDGSTGNNEGIYLASNGSKKIKLNSYYISLEGNTNEIFQATDGTNIRMRMPGNGNLLLGTTTDAGEKLQVNGTARVGSTLQLDNGAITWGNFSGAPTSRLRITRRTGYGVPSGIEIGALNSNTSAFVSSPIVLGDMNTLADVGCVILGLYNNIQKDATTVIGTSNSVPLVTGVTTSKQIILGDANTANGYTNGQVPGIIVGYGNTQNSFAFSQMYGTLLKPYADGQLLFGANAGPVNPSIREVYIGYGYRNEVNSVNQDNGNANNLLISPSHASDATDKNGGNLTLAGSRGTGAGTPGNLIFATATATTTGTTLQTLSERMRITGTGNVGVGEVSPTARLQVKGSGNSSATTSLRIQNAGGVDVLKVTDDMYVTIQNTNSTECFQLLGLNSDASIKFTPSGGNSRIVLKSQSSGLILGTVANDWADVLAVSAAQTLRIGTLTPAGGGVNYYASQNGAAGYHKWFLNGVQNAQLTGAQFVLDDSGTVTRDASSILQANSTSKGFLPPRMTNAQRAAITSPAIGLMVYCTDAVEGIYVYKSTGWTFVA